MIGYPEREQKTMQACDLGQYMSRGYGIEAISFEEVPDLVQMEIQYTGEGLPVYTVVYVRPGAEETPEHPRR